MPTDSEPWGTFAPVSPLITGSRSGRRGTEPATYTKLFDQIRSLFSQTPEARAWGYTPGRFSFKVKGGRCEACAGDGTIKIEMHFLPDVYVPCEVCGGRRYNRETLEILWKGHNISEVLEMSVEEALGFFENQPKIVRILQTLFDAGLGYVRLGQPATILPVLARSNRCFG